MFNKAMRAAGQKLGEFDDMYSKAIRDTAPSNPQGNWDNFRTGAAHVMGVDRNGGFFDPADERYNKTVDNVAKGAAVASRYVLPAGGVTAAGMALYELTNQFGGAADRPEPGQLGMGN